MVGGEPDFMATQQFAKLISAQALNSCIYYKIVTTNWQVLRKPLIRVFRGVNRMAFLGKEGDENKFVDDFADFYLSYFSSLSESIAKLGEIQKKHKKEYESIRDFNKDPKAIEILMENLSPEKQSTLLRLLLKSGSFAKDMASLFDSSAEEKKKLAMELKKFSGDLANELKMRVEKK